jgi:hypothetical protein
VTLLASLVAVSSCELGTVTVGKTTSTIVVHGVLNPSSGTQVVLVERTLSGAIEVPEVSFDPNDPIVTAGGIPVSGALAEIIDSTGRTFVGVEDRAVPANNGKGAGVYRFPLGGGLLRLGTRYQLHVRTAEGEDVTAFTTVPAPQTTGTGSITRVFNRDHDTLVVQWTSARAARSYALRVETPFGPFFLFTDSLRVRITGELRNPFASELQRVLIPGFRQDVLLAAVDSNFYDYYRTNNDPFTGSGIISRVTGGLGLFGSLVTLNTGSLTVVADQTEPIEGRFRLVALEGPEATGFAGQFTLYVESKAVRSDVPAALSGRYVTGGPGARADGMIGEQRGSAVTLALLANQLAADTADVFTGELRGDTLVGTYRHTRGTSIFVRIP